MTSAQRGFSLLELALVLLVMGAVGLVAWRLVPMLVQTADGNATDRQLHQAEQAVLGFALANGRLPCPDSDGDGTENCGSHAGQLPLRTLGLSFSVPVRYAAAPVLTVAQLRYLPPMPGAPARTAGLLDLCVALRDAQRSGLPASAQALGMDIAFGVAAPRQGRPVQVPSRQFPAPGDPAAREQARTPGLPVTFARLGCPGRLAQADALAQRVLAAEQAVPVAAAAVDFQQLAVAVRDANLVMALAKEAIAAADLTVAVAAGVTGTVLTVQTAGSVAPAVAAAAAAVVAGTANLVLATITLVDAEDQRRQTRQRLVAAEAYHQRTGQAATAERTRAVQRYQEAY